MLQFDFFRSNEKNHFRAVLNFVSFNLEMDLFLANRLKRNVIFEIIIMKDTFVKKVNFANLIFQVFIKIIINFLLLTQEIQIKNKFKVIFNNQMFKRSDSIV